MLITIKKFTLIFIIGILLSNTAMAKDTDTNALNICALAIPLVNQYIVNYEHLFARRHGFAARIEHAPLSDSTMSSTGNAFVLNYRWHFTKGMESIFLGPYVRYKLVTGSGYAGGTAFEFNLPEWNVGINVGKRWVWKNGFNVLLAAGYGKSWTNETVTPTNAAIDSTYDTFKKNNPNFINAPGYGEFSIGYVF